MNENNNEADALFATRRKKQQDEEAQKAAKIAEEEKMAELERQKQEVAEEIKRLETLQALQKEQEEKQALLEQQAQAEKAAKAAEKAEKKANKQPFDIKKYLPFILIGAGALVVIIVIIIIIAASSKSGKNKDSFAAYAESADWYRQNKAEQGLAYAYPSVFSEGEDEEFGEDYDIYYYYDEKSGQAVEMAVSATVLDATTNLMFSSEEIMKLGLTQVIEQETTTKDYKYKKYSDDIYYVTNSFDTVEEFENMFSLIVGRKDDLALEIYFYVSPNDEGKPRTIDFDDLLEIYNIMLDHMSIG